jgi:hypothetical protein
MRLVLSALVLCLLLGCQPASVAIWGEVRRECTCHDEPLARVYGDLHELPVEFKVETATEGWQLFSVTFDPNRVSRERVQAVLLEAGALIIPAP